MRRQQGARPVYRQATTARRIPNQQQRPTGTISRNTINTPTSAYGMYGTPVGIGRPLAERPANMAAEVKQKRRELQEKYCREAAEAEEKKLRRERKKREEWLKRQESLVRPGQRLGHGTQMSNFQRDLIEHQSFIDVHPQEADSRLDERDRQLRMLVQQRMERKIETIELNKKIQEFVPPEAYVQQNSERTKNTFKKEHSGPTDPMKRAASARPPQNASSNSNANGPANLMKPVNFLGVAQNAPSPASNINGPANLMKPANFLGVAQNTPSPASNINDTAQEPSGHVLGSGDSSSGLSPRQNEVDYREQMRAARLRMQTQYNEEVKRAAQEKAQEIDDMAEELGQISLK